MKIKHIIAALLLAVSASAHAGNAYFINPSIANSTVDGDSIVYPTGVDLYVNPSTGADTGDCQTQATPCLTIAYALTQLPFIVNGSVDINLADGTYSESALAIPSVLSRDTSQTLSNTLSSMMVVRIVGNATTPASVVISHGATTAMRAKNLGYSLRLEGITFSGTTTSLIIENSEVFLKDLAFSTTGIGIIATFGSFVHFEPSTNDFTFTGVSSPLSAQSGTNVVLAESIVATGVTSTCVSLSGIGTIFQVTSANPGIDCTFTAAATSGISASTGAVFSYAGTGTLHLKDMTNVNAIPINASWEGVFRITSGTPTINIDNCPVTKTMYASRGGSLYSINGVSWQYTNGSTSVVYIDPDSSARDTNGFDGATFAAVEVATAYKYGSDWRYPTIVRGQHSGTLPLGTTGYFGASAIQSVVIPLYVGVQDEQVYELNVVTGTANGAAHSDVYTVVKNGSDTTMTCTITNGSICSTTTNPVTLADGDIVQIKVVTDAATTGANAMVQATVIKQ